MDNDVIIPRIDDEITEAEEEEPPDDLEDQLEDFRSQWQQELTNQNSNAGQARNKRQSQSIENENEEKAKMLFLQGVSSEQNGMLYEAIEYYRRAMQIVPDIERKIDYQAVRSPRGRTESESSISSLDAEDLNTDEDLVRHFQKLQMNNNANNTCQPMYMQTSTHFSALPLELVIYIFKWVVTPDLDMKSLENLSQVCRGFYLCSRDEEIWRLACLRIWNVNVGKAKKFGGWRNMYIDRPHLHFNGCYMCKCTYYRPGEKSLDGFYRPIHIVEYYRYTRFFPDGTMLMMTSPEDPLVSISKLRSPHNRVEGMLKGFYRLATDTVTGVLKRTKQYDNSKSYYKYKRDQRQQNDPEQTFHVELQMLNVGDRKHVKLVWKSFFVSTVYRSTAEENTSHFELNNKNYPPLIYSRVKSYSAFSTAPLE